MRLIQSLLSLALLVQAAPAQQATCERDRVTGSDSADGDGFGYSMAAVGDLLVCGAQWDDDFGTDSGSAYVFRRQAGVWTEVAKLTASDAAAGARFGFRVDCDGTTIAVSAVQAGLVYVFEDVGGSWTEVARLRGSDTVDGDAFGSGVAVQGSWVAVGASSDDDSAFNAGTAFLFERQGSTWVETQKLLSPTPDSWDAFGSEVVLGAGGQLAVSVPMEDIGGLQRVGAVFLFAQDVSGWSLTQRLEGSGLQAPFGSAVDFSGERLAIGAGTGDLITPIQGGVVYVFERDLAGVYSETAVLTGSPTPHFDGFGMRLDLEGNLLTVAAAAQLFPIEPGASSAAYLYEHGVSGWALLSYRRGLPGSSLSPRDVALAQETWFITDDTGPSSFYPAPDDAYDVQRFCFCETAGCSNEEPEAGCQNETGGGSSLVTCGSTSVGLDDLTLIAEGIQPGRPGLFFMGAGTQPATFFGNGRLCVNGGGLGLRRFPVHFADSMGALSQGPGLVAHATASFPQSSHIQPGDTWNFQCWYRDLGACGTGFNVSNGLSVSFSL